VTPARNDKLAEHSAFLSDAREEPKDIGFKGVSAGGGPAQRRNLWAGEEHKGVNSRWRVPESGHLFEVQFHTQASLDAKEETHGAYEQIRSLPDDDAEVSRLHAYQREVTAKVPTPPRRARHPRLRRTRRGLHPQPGMEAQHVTVLI